MYNIPYTDTIPPGELVQIHWSSDVIELGVVRSYNKQGDGGYEVEIFDRDGDTMYFWRNNLKVL